MAEAYYIYYRVAPGREEVARHRVDALLREVLTRCGIQGRWLRRHGEPLLWMEIYEPVTHPDLFETALREAVTSIGFGDVLQAGAARKLERFGPCA